MSPEPQNTRFRTLNFVLAELKESSMMAMSALGAHKLRSALTLLGVLVGVFSIIVVMTVMQAMQKQIATDMNQLGGQTFKVSKWPEIFLGEPRDAGAERGVGHGFQRCGGEFALQGGGAERGIERGHAGEL